MIIINAIGAVMVIEIRILAISSLLGLVILMLLGCVVIYRVVYELLYHLFCLLVVFYWQLVAVDLLCVGWCFNG